MSENEHETIETETESTPEASDLAVLLSESTEVPAETEPPPAVRDHYVVATTEDGRRVPIWCGERGRQEFYQDEAIEVARIYERKMTSKGVKMKYEAVGIEEWHLANDPKPPQTEGSDAPKLVHGEITFAKNSISDESSGAAPLPAGATLRRQIESLPEGSPIRSLLGDADPEASDPDSDQDPD